MHAKCIIAFDILRISYFFDKIGYANIKTIGQQLLGVLNKNNIYMLNNHHLFVNSLKLSQILLTFNYIFLRDTLVRTTSLSIKSTSVDSS